MRSIPLLAALTLTCSSASTTASPVDVRVLRYDVQKPGPYNVYVDDQRGATLAFREPPEFAWDDVDESVSALVTLVFWRGSNEIRLKPTGKSGKARLIVYGRNDPGAARYDVLIQTVPHRAPEAYNRYEFYDGRREKVRRQRVVHESFDDYLSQLVLQGFGVVETDADAPSPHGLPLSLAFVSLRFGDQVKLVFAATNKGTNAVVLEDVRVTNGTSPVPPNHVAFIRLSTARPNDGLAFVAPGETVHGYLALSRAPSLGKHATVTVLAASGQSRSRSIQIWPPRDEPPPPPLPRSVGKLALGVAGSWGRAQLAATDGTGEWTPLRGAGVIATYGIFRWLSVEGALMTFDTDQTDIGVATGATVRLAALLHFGDRWVPFARLGVEPAVFRHDSRTQGAMLAPSVGIGVCHWIGDKFVVTLEGNYARQTDVLDLALVALRASYAWPL